MREWTEEQAALLFEEAKTRDEKLRQDRAWRKWQEQDRDKYRRINYPGYDVIFRLRGKMQNGL